MCPERGRRQRRPPRGAGRGTARRLRARGRARAGAARALRRARALPALLAGQRAASPTSPRRRRTRRSTRSYYAPLLGELRALGVGYGARPARIEVVPTARPLGGALRRPPGDDRARLGAPARPSSATALFYDESNAAHARRATARGCRRTRSPTSRCPTPRSTTPRRPRRACCAHGALATCAKSGARALAPVRRARRAPARAAAGRAETRRQRLVHAVRAAPPARTRCACASPRTGRWRRPRLRQQRAPGAGPRCTRAAPGSLHVVIALLARARVRPRPALHAEHRLGFSRWSPALVCCRRASCRMAGWTRSGRSRCSAPPTSRTGSCAGLVEGDANAAFAHARDLISLERTLHLFVEPSIQAWASGSHFVMVLAELAVRQRADDGHGRRRCCTSTCATTATSTSCATCS